MADEKEIKKKSDDFKASRKKKITVVTNSIIFLLLSLCAFGYYAYNSNLFKDGHSKQISTEIENNIVKETLAEGETLESKNN